MCLLPRVHQASGLKLRMGDVEGARISLQAARGERVSIALTLVDPLSYEDGEATFRLPLVVALRSEDLRTDRALPGFPNGTVCLGSHPAAASRIVAARRGGQERGLRTSATRFYRFTKKPGIDSKYTFSIV